MPEISKRTRFEIFKRDRFSCLYCGRRPPEIILNVDHIIPKSKGGDNSPSNLVTSCCDCNSGKSDIPLSELPGAHTQSMDQRREKLEQLKALSALCAEEQQQIETDISMVSAHWVRLDGGDPEQYEISGQYELSVRKFLRYLPPDEIIDALYIAYGKIPNKSDYAKFKFFCGVCWKKIQAFSLCNARSALTNSHHDQGVSHDLQHPEKRVLTASKPYAPHIPVDRTGLAFPEQDSQSPPGAIVQRPP